MYKGKYSNKKKRRLAPWAALALALVLTLSVGGTIAYLITDTGPVTNTFTPGNVACKVIEKFNGTTKSDVKIENTGNTDAYIRAAIVVTWQNASSGNVLGKAPVLGSDYTLQLATDTGWDITTSDGYYYYATAVSANNSTGILINECKVLKSAPAEGYTLCVEVLADAIQATPINAVKDAWGVTVDANGNISK